MQKSVKKRLGRPPGRKAPWRPVVTTRVSQEFYEAIKKAAQASGRTISEELVWRAQIAINIGDAQKLLSDIEHATEATLRARMQQRLGLRRIHDALGTYWAEPGMPPLKGRLDPEVKAAILEAVKEAFKNERGKP